MADYYIRTPDRDESRGPFNNSQLLTLAEAGQIDQNTLYYDESKEEWLPIILNEELKAEVFPERQKLKLKMQQSGDETAKKKKKKKKIPEKRAVSSVTEMLANAEKEPKSVRVQKSRQESLRKSILFSNNALSLIMLLYAFTLFAPHMAVINEAISSKEVRPLFNYPLLLLGLADFLLAIFIYFGFSEVRPFLRARSMLAFGFGIYIGWALGDSNITLASIAAGLGTFYATFSKRYSMTILAIIIGFSGSAVLAYFSFIGYFTSFLNSVYFELPF